MPTRTLLDRIARLPRDLVAVVAGITVVAVLGGLATDIGPWYFALQQPSFKPPDAAFGPAWMLIYLCTGRALLLAWRTAPSGSRPMLRRAALLNGAVNVAWSVLFFTLQRPDWALVGSALLLASILHLMEVCRRAAPAATERDGSGLRSWLQRPAGLLLPYLLWVAYATAINAGVVVLNGPFGV